MKTVTCDYYKGLNKLLYLIIDVMYHTKLRYYGNSIIALPLPIIAFILLLVYTVQCSEYI